LDFGGGIWGGVKGDVVMGGLGKGGEGGRESFWGWGGFWVVEGFEVLITFRSNNL
jgi:hypothetical protein